jgi:hypothetical protein
LEVKIHAFLNLRKLERGEWSALHIGHFTPEETPSFSAENYFYVHGINSMAAEIVSGLLKEEPG